jgi:hypothetical protein
MAGDTRRLPPLAVGAVAGLRQRAASARVRQRVERVAHEVAPDRARHDAREERADVERRAHRPHVRPRDPGADEPLAQVGEVGAPEGLRQRRVRAPVGQEAVVLGDDDGELRPPRFAARPLQPRVPGADRGGEVVQRAERVEVVERGSNGELVVALAVVGDDRAGEVQDAVRVAAVALVAGVVAARMLAVRGEDLLDALGWPG